MTLRARIEAILSADPIAAGRFSQATVEALVGVVEEARERSARLVELEAGEHQAYQDAANARRPGWTRDNDRKGWAPGAMWMTHGGIAGMYRELAQAIRDTGAGEVNRP